MNHHSSKASLFLMELIIAILVFSLSSAICVRFFAKAHLLTEDTQNLNHAISLAESAAEVFYGVDGKLTDMRSILDSEQTGILSDSDLLLFYNSSFSLCEKTEADYQMKISLSHDKNMQIADIRVINIAQDSKMIYQLNVKRYQGGDDL